MECLLLGIFFQQHQTFANCIKQRCPVQFYHVFLSERIVRKVSGVEKNHHLMDFSP